MIVFSPDLHTTFTVEYPNDIFVYETFSNYIGMKKYWLLGGGIISYIEDGFSIISYYEDEYTSHPYASITLDEFIEKGEEIIKQNVFDKEIQDLLE